jgi:hypothetical protein
MSELEQRARELLATQGCVDGFQPGQIADAVMVNPRRILRAIEAALRTQSTAWERELVEALRPFARQNPHKSEDGSAGILVPATVADVRRARQALRLHEAAEDGQIEYEVWQQDAFGDGDGMVAGSTSLADAQHYAAVYSQDAPAWVVEVTRRRVAPPVSASERRS